MDRHFFYPTGRIRRCWRTRRNASNWHLHQISFGPASASASATPRIAPPGCGPPVWHRLHPWMGHTLTGSQQTTLRACTLYYVGMYCIVRQVKNTFVRAPSHPSLGSFFSSFSSSVSSHPRPSPSTCVSFFSCFSGLGLAQ